jgi:hypothetical protein
MTALVADIWTIFNAVLIVGWQIIIFLKKGVGQPCRCHQSSTSWKATMAQSMRQQALVKSKAANWQTW